MSLTGKKMGAAGAMYDPHINKWFYNTKNNNNEIFKDGYEDPTYLTFKVEFGGWGYSVLDKSTLGFTEFNETGESALSNIRVTSHDYDELPIGLLDMHFAEDTFKQYSEYAFNNQRYYNAYNYLLSRNEDRRAEYLKNFVDKCKSNATK